MVVIKIKSTNFEKSLIPGDVCMSNFSDHEEEGKAGKRCVRREKVRFRRVGGHGGMSIVSQALGIKTG